MIIDVNTRIWSSLDQLGRELAERLRSRQAQRWGHLDASPAAHEQAMACLDGALVLGFRADRIAAHIPNEYVAQFVRDKPDRRVGIGGIDPIAADASEQIDAVIELGLVGVTVCPPYQGFHPTDSTAMRVYERASNANLPLLVVAADPLPASAMLEFGRPVHWDEVAQALPELRIVIGQLGHPWIDETLVLLSKHVHLYADISGLIARPWQLYNALLSASSLGVIDKLLFGSGFPLQTPTQTIETLYTINTFSKGSQLPTIPRAQLRGIVERDVLSCLGIDCTIITRQSEDQEIDVETPMIQTLKQPMTISETKTGTNEH